MFGFEDGMIFRIPALLLALTIHEYAHAQAAESMGDTTPSAYGRVTMNPLAHIDPIGLLLLLFAGFGWAKPVPINPSKFKNISRGIKLVSFAGPAANFFIAFMSMFAIFALSNFSLLTMGVASFLKLNILYNIWFGLFNLIPLPPLDGSRILNEYLPLRWQYEYYKIAPYSNYILLALVFTGIAGLIIKPGAQLIIAVMQSFLKIIF